MSKISKNIIIKCVIFAIISAVISTPLQLFNSIIIEGMTGKPEFVTVPFVIYAISMKCLFAFGYVLLGIKLPIRNTRNRAVVYMLLVWGSSYLPNVLAMMGGDGEIMRASLSLSIVICDSITYIMDGFILGILMSKYECEYPKIAFPKERLVLSCITNGFVFTSLIFIFDLIGGSINSSWYVYKTLAVSDLQKVKFYIIFLGFMFIAGTLHPILYRFTQYPNASLKGNILWAILYAVLIWNPIVIIMIFFGTELVATICYAIVFLVILLLSTLIYTTIFYRKSNTYQII